MSLLKVFFVAALLTGGAVSINLDVVNQKKVTSRQEQGRLTWIPNDEVDLSQLTPAGGENVYGYKTLYVGRANHNGEWVPGKAGWDPEESNLFFHFSYNGQELGAESFELLNTTNGILSWVRWKVGTDYPSSPVYVDANSDTYICRGFLRSLLLIGKSLPGTGTCNVPFQSDNILTTFEILVINDYGVHLGLDK